MNSAAPTKITVDGGIPDVDAGWQTVVSPAEQLRLRAATEPTTPFVKCGGDWITFRDLDEKTNRVAAGLAALGLSKGDRLAIMLPTLPEYIELIFACAKIGVIFVPVNIYLKGEFLHHQLATSGPSAVVVDAPAVKSLGIDYLTSSSAPIAIGVGESFETSDTVPGLVPYASLSHSTAAVPEVSVAPSDLMSLMFTSGTTGRSKACQMSHSYYYQVARMYIAAGWVAEGDKIVTALPLYHAGGQIAVLMSALFSKSSVSFLSSFSATTFMKEAYSEGATSIWGVAAMASAVLAQPVEADPAIHGQLRIAVWIPLDTARQEEFENRFGTRVVADGYGQSEATAICLNPVGKPRLPGTIGYPASLIEVRLVDDHDDEVPDGEIGEFAIRPLAPGAIFSGYWENDGATVAATRNLWFHTGDYGRKLANGAFAFVDRKKDAVRRRGENVSSIELESAIRKHELIDDVVVHAVPSPMTEDDIKACLIARGERPDPAELLKFFESNLPYFCIPRYVEFFDEFPVNSVGRVLKHELRANSLGPNAIDLTGDRYSLAKDKRR